MPVTAKIIINSDDVSARLDQLNLSTEELQEVVKHYIGVVNSLTADHPSWGKGITPASETIFALRSILRSRGWRREEERRFALTVYEDANVSLALNAAIGDAGTGDPLVNVETISDKGICTSDAICENQLLLDIPAPLPDPTEYNTKRQTWYLLMKRKDDGVHAELSLPLGLSPKKHISLWLERIILPITKLDHNGPNVAGFEDNGFEITLTRKGNKK